MHSFSAFADELLKIAVRFPVMHGTFARFRKLAPAVSKLTFAGDPNPRAVYTMVDRKRLLPKAVEYAEAAVRAHGGEPLIAHAKADTRKGWLPSLLNAEGKATIGTVDDARALVDELDAGAVEPRRGEIWKLLQRGTGRWGNVDPSAELRPSYYRPPGGGRKTPGTA